MSNPHNEQALRDIIGSRIDTAELERELEVQQKLLPSREEMKTDSVSRLIASISMIRTMRVLCILGG